MRTFERPAALKPAPRASRLDTLPAAPRRWWLHPAIVVLVASCAALLRSVESSGLSNDVYWQWATGRWMLDHHAIAARDVFSYTALGRPWLDEEWGFQALLAGMVRTVGPVSFWIVSAGSCIAALGIGVLRWRRIGASWLRVAALSAMTTAYLLFGDAPRPQAFSYLCFSIELWVLLLARRHTRWLLALPVLFVFWANVHGSFVAGLAVLLLAIALPTLWRHKGRIERVRAPALPTRAGVLCLLSCVAASLLNPRGPALIAYAIRVTANSQLATLVEEWQSPNFHSIFLLGLVVLPIGVAVWSMVRADASFELFDLLVASGFLVASLHSQRFLPYFGIALAGLLAGMSPGHTDRLVPSPVWPVIALGVALALVGVGPHVTPGTPQRSGDAAVPVAATGWLTQHAGRVFSTYEWSDYLISRGIPVFVDGRTDLYFGTSVLTTWIAIDTLRIDPDPVLARFHVRYVLWPPNSALAVYLQHDPAWQVVRRAGPALIFERISGAAAIRPVAR